MRFRLKRSVPKPGFLLCSLVCWRCAESLRGADGIPGGVAALGFAGAGALIGAYAGIVLRRTMRPSAERG